MNTFILKDKEIDSLGLEDRIKSRVSEKIEKGIYTLDEIEDVSKKRPDIFLDLEDTATLRIFHYLYSNWDITREFPITSHRPFTGPFIVLAKKVVRFLVRLYTKPIFKRQAGFNHDLILFNKEILKELKRLRKDVEALKDR